MNDKRFKLIQGDCLEIMPKLANDGVKVDLVLTDPPYGTTSCKWDNIIPFEPMWDCLNQLTYDKTPMVLFGSEPFSSNLRRSNIKNYKYDWIWEKEQGVGFQLVKYRPLIKQENISVFCKKTPNYSPQMIKRDKPTVIKRKANSNNNSLSSPLKYSNERISIYDEKYPTNILKFNRDRGLHPTQKPVKLLEYLIKTYTNENDLVLDFTMGSGSTGVACLETNRKFIGIELEPKYFEIAEQRIKEAKAQKKLI